MAEPMRPSPIHAETHRPAVPAASSQIDEPLTGPRWSSAVQCPRRAFYDAAGAPKAPPTEQQKRWFRRGHAVSNAIRDEIIAEYRAAGRAPRREETVAWPADDPIGTGHIDLYVPSEAGAVELTTNSNLRPKALQVAGYALNHPRAESAVVLYIDPSTFEETAYPVDLEALAPRVREIEAAVVEAVRSGTPCDRVCRTPGDGPAQFCPYVETCFAGWERPPVDELIADPIDVEALAAAEEDVTRAGRDLALAKEKRDAARDQLRPLLPAGEMVECGGVRVKRSVSVSDRFSLAKYRETGHALPDEMRAFVSSSESERWTVRRLEPPA